MDIELLAKLMREKALLEEGGDLPKTSRLDPLEIAAAKKSKQAKVEQLKKLYFNAGRWSAGARDRTARLAFERIQR
jgi:hypothetical protein